MKRFLRLFGTYFIVVFAWAGQLLPVVLMRALGSEWWLLCYLITVPSLFAIMEVAI